jgi:hypothetical protein
MLSLLLLSSAVDTLAQSAMERAPQVPHLYLFPSAEDDTTFFNANYETSPNKARHFFLFDRLPGDYGVQPQQGTGAMVINWQMFADQSWGGSMGVGHSLPNPNVSSPGAPDPDAFFNAVKLYDISDFTHFNLWYYVLEPASGGMTFRIKLHDASLGVGTAGDSQTEDWTAEFGGVLSAAPGWRRLSAPLEAVGFGINPVSNGFVRPGCSTGANPLDRAGCWSGLLGNERFDLDKISGFVFEFVGSTSLQGTDSTAFGTIAFDNVHVSGVRYNLLNGFDNIASLEKFQNTTAGNHSFAASTDTVQGSGSLNWTYNLVADQGWGGSVGFNYNAPNGHFPNMSERSHISLFYKVVEPVSNPNANFQFKLIDNSSGTDEVWEFHTYGMLNDTSGEWQRLLIPLTQRDTGGPNDEGFVIPPWVSGAARGDETLNLNNIRGIRVEIGAPQGQTANGVVLIDRLTTYGVRPVVADPPVAPANLAAAASSIESNSIQITWSDVPGQTGERYEIFYSREPITAIDAPGVLLAATGVARATELYTHRILTANEDRDAQYYYAIRAIDALGQTGEFATTASAASVTGLGVPTISMAPPANFTADGNLEKWNHITPFHLRPEGPLGYIPETSANFTITDSNDLSAKVYLAVNNEALYFAFDVTDDVFVPVPDGVTNERWLYDGAELYIGLYDETSPRHAGLRSSGPNQDYKFLLFKQNALLEGAPVERHIVHGDGSYYFAAKQGGGGYVVEGRMPYTNFVREGAAPFVPRVGMRIPLDIVIMDNDTPGTTLREGILAYSFYNNDNSWQSPRNWMHTWIEAEQAVSIVDNGGVPDAFELYTNYPNPFNPSTLIAYDIPQNGRVTLKVFNMLGQEVATLVDGVQVAGRHEVRFDARDLASGVYLYRIQAGSFVKTKKMHLVR